MRKFSIILSAFIIISSIGSNHINNYLGSDVNANVLKELRKQYIVVKTNEKPEPMEFIVTAYDLSFNSCQKSRGSKGYGITSSGFDLRGHTLSSARIISVDPSIIPLGSKVRLTFKEDKYKKYDNIYRASDVGGGIINYKIDLFVGDFSSAKASTFAINFGVTKAYVEIIE